MFLGNIVDNRIYQPIKEPYERWYKFLKETIEFWLPDSEWHNKAHCSRVLLLALHIGHQKGLSAKEMDILGMAAVFHDSRRVDDWIDKEHGMRAAKYYADYCSEHDMSFDRIAYNIIYFHNQEDSLGLAEIANLPDIKKRGVLLYQIFKDADALDRLRLGQDALNVDMFRTKEAKRLVNIAKFLLHKDHATKDAY